MPFTGRGQAGVSLVLVTLRVTITTGPFSVSLSNSSGRVMVRHDGFALLGAPPEPGSPYYFGHDLVWLGSGESLDSTWTLSGCTFTSDSRTLLATGP